jgi:hypothetical protein
VAVSRLRRLVPSQEQLDRWHPTVVRYLGIVGFVYAFVFDRGEHVSLLVAAAGAFGYKTLHGALTNPGNGGE